MKGVIAATHPLAVEEGAKVLRNGGNAMDAAIVTAFVQGVVEPDFAGIGGCGTLTFYDASISACYAVDFYSPTPLLATADMFATEITGMAPDGRWMVKDFANEIGYRSICVPGTVAGLHLAANKFGTMDWADLLQPAISIADEGVTVYSTVYDLWQRLPRSSIDSYTRFTATAEAARLFTANQSLKKPGDIMDLSDYAATLRILSQEGPATMYHGDLRGRIVADMVANGGLLRNADFEQYQATTTIPVTGTYRGFAVYGPPPPGAGAMVVEVLNILEEAEVGKYELNDADHLFLLSQALRIGFNDWATLMSDPGFPNSPVDSLTNKRQARELMRAIIAGEHLNVIEPAPESPHTTHVSVMDSRGNAASLTHSLSLGSGVVTKGLGFMYNDALALFDPRPDQPNSISPGRLRLFPASACILVKDGQAVLAVGAPGASGIISGVIQTISNVVDFGMSPQEAVAAPRIHAQGNLVRAEAGITRSVVAALRQRGLNVRHSVQTYSYATGRVHAVGISPHTGQLTGGADPRSGGIYLNV